LNSKACKKNFLSSFYYFILLINFEVLTLEKGKQRETCFDCLYFSYSFIKNNIIPSQLLNQSSDVIDNNFKNYVLNVLKNLKSKLKILTIVVGNSNNSCGYSVYSGKLEATESGYGFMGVSGYKIMFKDVRHLNKYIYIDLRDLSLYFEDGSVISGTTNDPYDLDDSIVLASSSL
jgi:hypothetical protein